MIDWLTLIIPLPHEHFSGGKTLSYDEDGVLIFEKSKGKSIEGSADNKIYISSNNTDELFISGNPAKFLQGHNVFGIDNPYRLAELLLYFFYNNNTIEFNAFDIKNALDNTQIARIDINYSYLLPSNNDVDTFLNALHYKGKTRHGKAQRKGGTVYFGKHSSRYSLKFYNKLAELNTAKESKKIYNNLTINQINTIYKEAKNLLRCELVLRSLELKEKGMNKLKEWNNKDKAKTVFNNYFNKLNINKQTALTDKIKQELPSAIRATYYQWFHSGQAIVPGQDLTKPTFYRHRKIFMDRYGIDISLPRDPSIKKEAENTVPFFRILEAKPVEIPQSFYDLNLIAM